MTDADRAHALRLAAEELRVQLQGSTRLDASEAADLDAVLDELGVVLEDLVYEVRRAEEADAEGAKNAGPPSQAVVDLEAEIERLGAERARLTVERRVTPPVNIVAALSSAARWAEIREEDVARVTSAKVDRGRSLVIWAEAARAASQAKPFLDDNSRAIEGYAGALRDAGRFLEAIEAYDAAARAAAGEDPSGTGGVDPALYLHAYASMEHCVALAVACGTPAEEVRRLEAALAQRQGWRRRGIYEP